MTLKLENPINWSSDAKALAQLAVLVITIIGSVGGLGIYLGDIKGEINAVQYELVDEKSALKESNEQRQSSLNNLKGEVIPRIDNLERAVHAAETEASAAKQRSDDMKEDLKQLKDLAVRNLNVTESHDADIKATREAVAPKDQH
jgi:hypothetical protein